MKYLEYLAQRTNTFSETMKWIHDNIDETKTFNIVELGTSRSFKSWGISSDTRSWYPDDPSKWAWSDGFFTRLFADNMEGYNFKIYSVDPCDQAVSVCKVVCGHIPQVSIHQMTSTEFLSNFNEKIDLLYMDHLESGIEACKVHFEDAKLVIEKDLMSDKSLILIDDTPVTNTLLNSKGHLSIPYLMKQGYRQVIHEYQLLLKKE